MIFDDVAWNAHLTQMASDANSGCGLSYDLFEERFSAAVEGALRSLPAEHRPAAQVLAFTYGYATPAELAASRERDAHDGYCCHGMDPHCCPVGCGDRDDGDDGDLQAWYEGENPNLGEEVV